MKPAYTHLFTLLTAMLLASCATEPARRPLPDKTAAEEQDPNAPTMGPMFMPMR
jgi:uncharacterized lipoprotein YajG